ncbi:MAG: ASCH domain-containing protein [bacterium]|nr:ASCH domain-containing protein [bacterium]
MIHNMKLNDEPFNKIKSGSKTIEMRLYDEKRSLIKIGDIIYFTNRSTNESLEVKVINLYKFNSFKELYQNFDKTILGYNLNEIASYKDMFKYYSLEDEKKYGVVGIEIKLQ